VDTLIALVFFAFAVGIIREIMKPRRCSVCNSPFKRRYYTWTIGGKKQHMCPGCSSRMDRKISKQKFEQKFGR